MLAADIPLAAVRPVPDVPCKLGSPVAANAASRPKRLRKGLAAVPSVVANTYAELLVLEIAIIPSAGLTPDAASPPRSLNSCAKRTSLSSLRVQTVCSCSSRLVRVSAVPIVSQKGLPRQAAQAVLVTACPLVADEDALLNAKKESVPSCVRSPGLPRVGPLPEIGEPRPVRRKLGVPRPRLKVRAAKRPFSACLAELIESLVSASHWSLGQTLFSLS